MDGGRSWPPSRGIWRWWRRQSIGTTGAFRYAGARFDAETGLVYLRARHYSPTLGRFLQPDPVGTAGGVNLYAYALNDPINRRDPRGTTSEPGGGLAAGIS